MSLLNRGDARGQIFDRRVMSPQRQANVTRPVFQCFERVQVMSQTGIGVYLLRGLMRGDLGEHLVAGEEQVVQADDHMTGAMPWRMEHLKGAEGHPSGLVCKIHRDGLVIQLAKLIRGDELGDVFGADPRLGEEGVQPAGDQVEAFFGVRQCVQIKLVDANAG